MNRPASFADLDAWSVYADWLQQQGDPRGEVIAMDLALPVSPDRESLATFHAAHRSVFRDREYLSIAYALGHPREVVIAQGRSLQMSSVLEGTLANARDLLADPTYGLVESVTLSQPFEDHGVHWQRLLAAIPPSCRRVVIVATGLSEAAARELVERLPATVRELAIRRIHGGIARDVAMLPLIDDRFDVVELIDQDATFELRKALAKTARLRLRVDRLDGVFAPRIEIGEAALLFPDRDRPRAYAIPRHSLRELQRHHGPIAIRAQLARSLPESYGLSPAFGATSGGRDLLRTSDVWTLHGPAADMQALEVDGTRLAPDEIVRLDHGSRIRFGDDREPWVFLARDATVEARALWS